MGSGLVMTRFLWLGIVSDSVSLDGGEKMHKQRARIRHLMIGLAVVFALLAGLACTLDTGTSPDSTASVGASPTMDGLAPPAVSATSSPTSVPSPTATEPYHVGIGVFERGPFDPAAG